MLARLGLVCAAALLVPAAVLAQAAPAPYRDGGEWLYPWHMMGWGWGIGWIFPLLVILGIVFCIVMMSRMFGHAHGPRRDGTSSALEVLNERFAGGEISKEEFEEKRAILARRS